MEAEYEYKPPHNAPKLRPGPAPSKAPPTLEQWDVSIPLGSELIQRRVSAVDKTKAFKRVVMELSRSLNQQPAMLFKRIYADKKYTVKPVLATTNSSFLSRAAYLVSPPEDLKRIERLPLVESARVFKKTGSEVVYRAVMPLRIQLHQIRELTGHLQNLFGDRLLSSGSVTEEVNGAMRNVVEVRISLLSLSQA